MAYEDLVNNSLVPAELFVTWLHEETRKKVNLLNFFFAISFFGGTWKLHNAK